MQNYRDYYALTMFSKNDEGGLLPLDAFFVRIRHLRPNWTIAEPLEEGDGLSRPEWTSPEWPSLAVGLGGATPGAMPRVWPSSQVATTTAGERLRDRHMPGGRRPLGPANVGVTEDRRQVVWRIKQELK